MNKILIFAFIIFCTTLALGQTPNPTVSISCNSTSSNCFNIDPECVTALYNLGVASSPDGTWIRSINWDVDPVVDGAIIGPDNASTVNVRWENTSNTTIKRIKVTVTWTKVGQTNIVRTVERVVTVKHIAPISNITITGGGVSGAYSNNATVPVPCGTRTFTLTAAPPTTSPSTSVVYQWVLPSGWSGSSTTNSITVTAPAGSTDQLISLRYRRSDYNCFLQYFDLLMDRPQVGFPSISGLNNDVVCSGETKALSGSATNATSFSWSGTSGITATPNNTANTNISATQSGTLTLTANNACQAPQSVQQYVQAGTPTLYGASPNQSINYINGNTLLRIESESPCASYKWRIVNGSGYILPNSGACGFTFNGVTYNESNVCYVSTSNFVRVEVKAANRCGVGGSWTYYLQNGSGFMMTSANPANSTVSLQFTSDFAAENLKRVEFIRDGDLRTARNFTPGDNQQNAAFRSNRTVAFDVTNLPRGKYYLHVVYKDEKKFSEIVLLQ
ncbi:MAG: hypothetical protein ACK4TA_03500 [Saprospiraceae bacterium]